MATTDIQFPEGLAGSGTFTATVVDNNLAPSTVLEASEPFTIQCTWNIDALTADVLGGEWQLAAYVESIGPGPEQQVGDTTSVAVVPDLLNYAGAIEVDAFELPDNVAPPESGAYKLVTLLTHLNGNITDISAVVEEPVLRIS